MSTDIGTLNEMIEVLNDGKKFYQEASNEVRHFELKSLFGRMARTKEAIAADLKTAVRASGTKPADGGSLAGTLRKAYAEARAKLSSDKDYVYVAQLEEFEDRILNAFKDAAVKSDDPSVRTIAQRHMPEVVRDHNEMRTLKHVRTA